LQVPVLPFRIRAFAVAVRPVRIALRSSPRISMCWTWNSR
jgi:hypothetical protein